MKWVGNSKFVISIDEKVKIERLKCQSITIYHLSIGTAVKITTDRMDLMKKMFRAENFNVMASNMMSLQRTLDDVRHPDCKTINYPMRLPKASIIICFHNEVWSTLIRTIWSIINRTPKELLEEIILGLTNIRMSSFHPWCHRM